MPDDSPYWTLDTSLFEGRFTYFGQGSEPVQVRGKVHIEEERYSRWDINQEIVPIAMPKGQGLRTYVHMKPFVLIPNITVTVGLFPQTRADGAIGEVMGAKEIGHKEVEIGQAQAWYYPQDRLIVLWECFLQRFALDQPLLYDANMAYLWHSFARFLRKQCTGATRITTPFHDPLFDNEEYEQFLRSLGYEQVAKAAYGKPIERA